MKNILETFSNISKNERVTITKLEQKIGASKGVLSRAITNKSDIQTKWLLKLVENYPQYNSEWVLTGKGPMLKNAINKNTVNLENDIHLIPLYDGIITASLVNQDLPPQTEAVEMVDAGDWFRDATSAMRVHGDSMFPDYVSGSIVAMKEVFNKRLIVYGEDYLIETSEYRVLKRLQKSDLPQNWLLCSTNEDMWENGTLKGRLIHEPFDIHIDDVTKICLILGSVKRNHSSRIVRL